MLPLWTFDRRYLLVRCTNSLASCRFLLFGPSSTCAYRIRSRIQQPCCTRPSLCLVHSLWSEKARLTLPETIVFTRVCSIKGRM
ncbi:hypothetical protein BD309DRAFT_958858 [Dichomitus squalens]|uniref:Uncharacterized protein n=1 Tax=Dichomitus squalens TaxID=114155 RepID=A0A4Q9NRL2_9APHY|nr:hypothetical protein BD309DRAFT_958858 [Dichomitus squalens]TBU60125.1 hypothetical protein BD310DRAFT_923388 [Dichomitus squalens]